MQTFTRRRLPFFWRVTAAALAPLMAAGPFVPSPLQAAPPAQAPLSLPLAIAPATASEGSVDVVPNRKLPELVLPSAAAALPDEPTTDDIRRSAIFSEPLIPSRNDTPAAELQQLGAALRTIKENKKREDVGALARFVQDTPASAWRLSLLVNLADTYFKSGYFSKALEAWEAAWEAGKNENAPELWNLANRAAAELAALNARLGRRERLRSLLNELQGRDIDGSARAWLTHAAEGLALMDEQPAEAYRCGPMAVGSALSVIRPQQPTDERIDALKSTHDGTSLAQLQTLAEDLGIGLKAKRRQAGGPLPLPAVVHWKSGHFAAVVRKIGDVYHVKDPTFLADFYVTQAAIDEEASGYFLMPGGAVDGVEDVTIADASAVRGKGNTTSSDPDECDECGKKTGGNQTNCSSGACVGMAGYSVHSLLVSLNVVDTPLSYTPAYGPSVSFTLTYNQQDARQPANFAYTNFGPSWTCDWVSYVTGVSRSGSAATLLKIYERGGGMKSYSFPMVSAGPGTPQVPSSKSSPNNKDGSYITQDAQGSLFTRTNRDGSQEIFSGTVALGIQDSNQKLFLIQEKDSKGNTLTFNYTAVSGGYRVASIQDATGLVTTVQYPNATSFMPSAVVDPFNRSASFVYKDVPFKQADGQILQRSRLWKIVDTVGITSEFGYDGTGFISSLTTPYGKTSFAFGDSLNGGATGRTRWIEATDPLGAKERIEFSEASPGIAFNDPAAVVPESPVGSDVPVAVDNSYLTARNTFYWDKKAMMDAPGDYTAAHITHWTHGGSLSDTAGTVESEKRPLENRIWYNYPGQSSAWFSGSLRTPSKVGRVLDDGSIQLQQYEYNEIGMMTKAIDPSGRETLFEYHGNGHDLHLVKQKNGAVYDILAEYTGYNAQHLPQIITDAAGRTTSHTYTAQGQILTTSRSRLVAGVNTTELMTYVYGTTQGASDYQRLKEVRGPGNVLLQSMTYDSAGRVESSTDSSNFTVTYAYDAMDRVTKVTYPDKTTQETYYRHLDPEWIKDRQGRWTQQFYDPLRRLTGVLDPENRFTEYKYCICGALESIIDAKGQETSFIRDIQSRVVQKIFPDGKLLQYEYEATTSRLKWTRDAKGQYTNYRYLIDNNLERVAYTNAPYSDAANPGAGITLERTQPGGPVVDSPVTYTYETSYNRVATMTDWTGPTSYGYYPVNTTDVGGDGLPIFGDGRLATVNGPLANDTITHTYDEYGRELGCDIAGATDGRTFDSLGQLKTTSNPLGTFNHFYIGASGRLDFTLLPNGVKADYDYHGAGQLGSGGNGDFRLKQIQNTLPGGGVISQQDYTFQPAGNIVTWKQAHNGAGGAAVTYSFGYDNADQLLGATQRNDATSGVVAEHGYRYDVAGNRLTEQSGSVVTTSSYNELNQLTARSGGGPMVIEGTVSEPASVAINGTPAKVTGNTFRGTTNVSAGQASVPITATDLQGNTTSKTLQFGTPVVGGAAATYSYDANGNLTGDGARSYEWDAANRLIAINYLPNNGRTEFGYNGRGQRVREIEKTSTGGYLSVKLLVWCGTELREQRDGGNIVVKRFYREGEQVVSGGNVGSYYYTRDHLGSVRELLDGHAAVRGRSGYDPYGRKTTTGQAVHQSSNVGGMHQHYFYNSSQTLAVNSGDKLVAYVWIDPASPPSEIMLQWCSAEEGFNHRAYWGANLLGWGTDGHYSRSYRGALPAAGQWVRLEVPASQLGLEGKTLHGMAFSLFNGTARWDHAGKRGATNVDTAWVDDAVPAGAVLAGDNDSWNWSTSGWAPQADKAYTGHYYHDRSALHLAYYRAYSAEVGRWLSRDPLSRAELREGPNLYRYVRNRPSIFGDLLGLKCPCGENLTAASALGLADATRASILASEAIREAQNAASSLPGGLAGINNGAADAFRHCLWSCKMAQNLDDGARDAKAMGDIHEACGSNPPAEQAMDQHNNAVGRSLFNPGVDCSSACMQAATDGTLQTSVGGTPPANNY